MVNKKLLTGVLLTCCLLTCCLLTWVLLTAVVSTASLVVQTIIPGHAAYNETAHPSENAYPIAESRQGEDSARKKYPTINKRQYPHNHSKSYITLQRYDYAYNTNVGRNLMHSILKFNRLYFVLAVLIFAIEILIALFTHDQIVRPYVGDVLVVMLIYCAVKSFLDTPVLTTALSVLAFSFVVESLQYLNIVNRLGLQNSKIAATVIGTSFAWIDICAYIIGIILVLIFEKINTVRNLKEKMKFHSSKERIRPIE